MRDIVIIGGGLAGLVSAILLKKAGRDVVLIEKKEYPFHKVCGEYISNEVRSFLERNDLLPQDCESAKIDTLHLTSIKGRQAKIKLDLGGFGISRFTLDHYLFNKAKAIGVDCRSGVSATDILFVGHNDNFKITLATHEELEAKVVIGAYGKRSKIDKKLNRGFIDRRSPYIGVKYHIRYDHPKNEVALHNFEGGYCGLNKVENDISNLCYLSTRENLKKHGQIPKMEQAVLSKNPLLRDIYKNAEFLFDQPEVINEISFETKKPVESHILMCGDSAGMIAPLCGNGMAMAIHSAKILNETIIDAWQNGKPDRAEMEETYRKKWTNQFALRLAVGRKLQKLFGTGFLSGMSVGIIKNVKPLAHYLVKKTHGAPF